MLLHRVVLADMPVLSPPRTSEVCVPGPGEPPRETLPTVGTGASRASKRVHSPSHLALQAGLRCAIPSVDPGGTLAFPIAEISLN